MDKKLLIIEDDPYIMRALSSILEIEGYALDCVTTGADALSKARSDPPDLFLLDLGLPDMDGLQVIQQLRTQTRRPIIILSARAQENEKVLALDYGADDYVTKPFGAKELKARIRSALRHTYISQESESLGRYRYICGPLTVDYQLERVFKNGEDMPPVQYRISDSCANIPRIRQGADVSNHNCRHMGSVCGRGKQPHTAREHG